MQSISQASFKQAAYHDKVTNNHANQAKFIFFDDQMHFLSSLKEDAQYIQNLAKPTHNSYEQLSKLLKKCIKRSQIMKEEVTYTRRDISMIEANTQNKFQEQLARNYEVKSQQIDLKLQKIESIVQIAQEKKKTQSFLQETATISINFEREEKIKKYLQCRQKIKESLKLRLILSGMILQLKKKQKEPLVIQKFINNSSYKKYIFQSKHKQYYRNNSLDILKQKKYDTQFLKSEKKQRNMFDPITKLQNKKLIEFQDEIVENQLYQLKIKNQKLQMINQSIKNSIQIQEDNKLLDVLSKKKSLDYQKSIVREVLAYRMMQARFHQRLAKYSYKWSFQYKIQKKHLGSQEWIQQQQNIQSKQIKYEIKRKAKSVQKNQEKVIINFIKIDQNKSIPKTNSSLEGEAKLPIE